MYKDRRELLGRRRDADAHKCSGALVGGHANLAAPLHCLSKIPRLLDVSSPSRTPRSKIFKSASVQFFTDFFFKQTENRTTTHIKDPEKMYVYKGRHWNEIDNKTSH